MDKSEEILEALEGFARNPTEEVPPLLGRYLERIATTGETLFSWDQLKPVFTRKMDEAMKTFNKEVPTDHLMACPNVENITFEAMRQRLLATVDSFTGIPFTIQRLCELITQPKKHYKRTDKFLRGIEKNMLVVSSVDPYGNKITSDPKPLVNGMMDSNGFNSLQNTPVKRAFLTPPAPANSPVTSGWFNNGGAAAALDSPTATSWPRSGGSGDGDGDEAAATATATAISTTQGMVPQIPSQLAREPIRPDAGSEILPSASSEKLPESEHPKDTTVESNISPSEVEGQDVENKDLPSGTTSTGSDQKEAKKISGEVTASSSVPGDTGGTDAEAGPKVTESAKESEDGESSSTAEAEEKAKEETSDSESEGSRRDSGDSQGFEASEDVSEDDIVQSSSSGMGLLQQQQDITASAASSSSSSSSKEQDSLNTDGEESFKRSQPHDSRDPDLTNEAPFKKIKIDSTVGQSSDDLSVEGSSSLKESDTVDDSKSRDLVESSSDLTSQESVTEEASDSHESADSSTSSEKPKEQVAEKEREHKETDNEKQDSHVESSSSSSTSSSSSSSSSSSPSISSISSSSASLSSSSAAVAAAAETSEDSATPSNSGDSGGVSSTQSETEPKVASASLPTNDKDKDRENEDQSSEAEHIHEAMDVDS